VPSAVRLLRAALEILRLAVTFRPWARLRARWTKRLIRKSGLFDERSYLAQCGEDPEARKDPIGHYLAAGAARGLEPTPLFDRADWVARNPTAGAPGKDAFVHFVRSRRGMAAIPVREASAVPRAVPGAALLKEHPFRAPPSGGAARRAWVVGAGTGASQRGAGGGRLAAIAEALRQKGWSVTFAPESFPEALAHLAAAGHLYRLALLGGPEQAFEALPALRAHAPNATIACDPAHLRALQGASGEEESPAFRERTERLDRMERVNAACSDVVLAATVEERDALLARIAGARVELLPDAELSAAKGELEAVLLGRAGAGGESA
jgi:hypothetical protein